MIKVGDRVIIHKPNDVNEFPDWTPSMDEYNGSTIIVDKMVDFSEGTAIIHNGWNFSVKWCEKLETQASPTDLKTLNSAPSAVKCAACGGGLKEPYPRIKFCPRCEK